MNCPRCQTRVASSQKFCGDCGEPLPWHCQTCGAKNEPRHRFCTECGAPSSTVLSAVQTTALKYEPSFSDPEQRQLTVIFADLTGSTTLGTRLEPEDFREVLQAWRNCVTGLVVRYGGRVTTHMGDGILAFFGYPQAHEADAERAVRLALVIVEAVRHLMTSAGPPGTLSARLGLATGPVIVGDLIGAGSSLEWSVVSETTNLASRLQTLAQPSMVIVDDLTRRLSGGMFEYAALNPARLKGIDSPVRAWTVLRETAVESRFEALRNSQLPLIGREDEANLLQRRWAKAQTGIGHAVVLVGEAGLGKSRLIAAFAEQLAHLPKTVLRVSCSPHYQDTPLYPLIRHFEAAAGFLRTDTSAQKFAKLQLLLSESAVIGQEMTAVLADLLSITIQAELSGQSVTPRTNELTFKAVLGYIEALATKAPLLAVVEDFHWSDPSTNALLDVMVNQIEQIPALLIISTRPEKPLLWSLYSQVTTQLLNGLDRRQAAVLVRQIAGDGVLADDAIGHIVERAQGVPLFLEELTRSILRSDLPNQDGSQRSHTLLRFGDAVPTSLNGLLMARLDQLGAGKEVAQASAVIGREFSFDMLQAVSASPTERLEQGLAELVRTGLISPKGPPANRIYAFYHALIQEIAYSSMLRDRRRAIHLRYAQALEKDELGPASTAPELLAAHFAEGHAADKSIEYYLKAAARATGRFEQCGAQELAACFVELDVAEKTVTNYLKDTQATGRFALAEIITYLQKALRQLAKLPATMATQQRELALQIGIGRALMEQNGVGHEEVYRTFERAHELCLMLGETAQLVQVYDGLSNYHVARAELDKIIEYVERLLELGHRTSNQQAIVVAYRAGGAVKALLGRFHDGRHDLEQAIVLYDGGTAVLRDSKVSAYAFLGICLTALGLPDSGAAASFKGIGHAERLSHRMSLIFGLRRACIVGVMRRDARQVLELSSRLLNIETKYQVFRASQEAGFFATWAQLQTKNDFAICEHLRLSIDYFENANYRNLLPFFMLTAAELMESHGNREGANSLLDRAAKVVETTNERWCDAEITRLRARLTPEPAGATKLLEASLSLAREQGALLWEVRAAADLARLLQNQGRAETARGMLAPVLARVTEGFTLLDFSSAQDLLWSLQDPRRPEAGKSAGRALERSSPA